MLNSYYASFIFSHKSDTLYLYLKKENIYFFTLRAKVFKNKRKFAFLLEKTSFLKIRNSKF